MSNDDCLVDKKEDISAVLVLLVLYCVLQIVHSDMHTHIYTDKTKTRNTR